MDDGEITVTIPASSRFVALTRVTAASLAAECDFDVDEIDALRIGANELVALLVEWAEEHGGERIELVYRLIDPGGVELRAAVEGGSVGGHHPLDPLARQILATVVDEFDVSGPRGRIFKRRLIRP